MLSRLLVQSVESGILRFQDEGFVFFQESIPLSLILFMHLRCSEILGPRRGGAGPGPVGLWGGQADCVGGSQRQVGVCFLFIGSQRVSRPCPRAARSWREGGGVSWLPASQPAPQFSLLGLLRPLPLSPLRQTSSPFPGQGTGGQGADVEGKAGRTGRDPSPQKILLTPSFLAACVTEVSLLVSHCPLLPSVSLGGAGCGVMVR